MFHFKNTNIPKWDFLLAELCSGVIGVAFPKSSERTMTEVIVEHWSTQNRTALPASLWT